MSVLTSLDGLVAQAASFGTTACAAGEHAWAPEGGRACPEGLTDECGQTVYVCRSCEAQDYGSRGGPGHTDCAQHCTYRDQPET